VYKKRDSSTTTFIFTRGIGKIGSDETYFKKGTYIITIPQDKEVDFIKTVRNFDFSHASKYAAIGIGGFGSMITGMVISSSYFNDQIMPAMSIAVAGIASIFGLSNLVEKIAFNYKSKKFQEQIEPYLKPGLSSDKQYDFHIIRKALE
jgi:hypothetical protein